MTQSLGELVSAHPTGSRLFLHSVLLSTVLGVMAAASAGSAPWWLVVVWSLLYLVAVLVLELLLKGSPDSLTSPLSSGPDSEAAYRSLPPVDEMIIRSQRIELLAGTLKTFTERSANLKALHHRHRVGAHIRLLVMAPQGDGVRIATAERQDRGGRVDAEDIRQEIIQSINRLLFEFSHDELRQILRLYRGNPHAAVARYDDQYIVTVYTHGRGGSSPSLALQRNPHQALCQALDRGFQELWEARSTIPLDMVDQDVELGSSHQAKK